MNKMMIQGAALLALVLCAGFSSSKAEAQDHGHPCSTPVDCMCQYKITLAGGWKVPYCRNRALNTQYPGVTRAVIAVYGATPKTYFDTVMHAGQIEGALADTTVVSPMFLGKDSIDEYNASNGNLLDLSTSEYLYWEGSSVSGNHAVNGTKNSAFAVVDEIIGLLISTHPDLQQVVIAGHSNGGQFVNRYAAATAKSAYTNKNGDRVGVSFFVSSPGSVVWLDSSRSGPTAGCSNYNNWRFGLADKDRVTYMQSVTTSQIKSRLIGRSIHTVIGAEDTGAFTSCEPLAQGANHVDLMKKYQDHLHRICLSTQPQATCDALRTDRRSQTHYLPNIGHSSQQIFESPQGRDILFNLE